MDIFNNDERKVVCVQNVYSGFDANVRKNAALLTVGELYTVDCVEVHSWHTKVYLKEFPGVEFNSVLFEEIEE